MEERALCYPYTGSAIISLILYLVTWFYNDAEKSGGTWKLTDISILVKRLQRIKGQISSKHCLSINDL